MKLLQFTNKHTFNCEAQLTVYKIFFSVQREYESLRLKGLNEDSSKYIHTCQFVFLKCRWLKYNTKRFVTRALKFSPQSRQNIAITHSWSLNILCRVVDHKYFQKIYPVVVEEVFEESSLRLKNMPATHLVTLGITHIFPVGCLFISRAVVAECKPTQQLASCDSFPSVNGYQ